MRGPFTFKLQEDGHKPTELSVVLTEEEHVMLDDYMRECDELTQSEPFRDGFPAQLSVKGRVGEPIQVTASLPSKDDIAVLLHRLRALILEREPASFVRVVSALKRKIEHADFRALLSEQQYRYDGRDLQKVLTISLNETILNSERVLRDWLNAYEYHRDRDKREHIDALFSQLPTELLRGIFAGLLVEKINAIGRLRQIIATILGKNKGGRFENMTIFTDAL